MQKKEKKTFIGVKARKDFYSPKVNYKFVNWSMFFINWLNLRFFYVENFARDIAYELDYNWDTAWENLLRDLYHPYTLIWLFLKALEILFFFLKDCYVRFSHWYLNVCISISMNKYVFNNLYFDYFKDFVVPKWRRKFFSYYFKLPLLIRRKVKKILNNLRTVLDSTTDVKLCWLAFLFVLLSEAYIVIVNTWFSGINVNFIFPNGPNPLLILIFVVWIYTWGVSNLRRTLFGRFTRGDRKLWFKAFASFWVVELVTVGGLYIAACWMSWGPAVIIHRNFLIPTKSFISELAFFTFIVWGLYLLRFFIKWNSWKSSSLITCFILIITACLIWKDLTLFWGRETSNTISGSRWRYINLHIGLYSMFPEWWTKTYMGTEVFNSSNFSVDEFVDNYNNIVLPSEYQYSKLLSVFSDNEWAGNSLPVLVGSRDMTDQIESAIKFNIFSVDFNDYDFLNRTIGNRFAYPRRVGFATKKLAMWTLFMVLKMWHHVIMFYWWFIFLLRLYGTRKNAYSILATCWFNVYCCFIIGLLVYLFAMLPFYENFLRTKPLKIRTFFVRKYIYFEALNYIFKLFIDEQTDRKFKDMLKEVTGADAFRRLVEDSLLHSSSIENFDIVRDIRGNWDYSDVFCPMGWESLNPYYDIVYDVIKWPKEVELIFRAENRGICVYETRYAILHEEITFEEELEKYRRVYLPTTDLFWYC